MTSVRNLWAIWVKKRAKGTAILLQYAPSTGRWIWCVCVNVSVNQHCLVLTKLSFIQPTRLSYGKVLFFTVREAKIPINIGELIISSLDALFLALFYVVSDLTFAWPSNIDFRTALSLLVRWCWALWRKSIADIMTSNVLAWIEWRGMSPLFI